MLKTFTVIYTEDCVGILWQYFRCQAEDADHAEEQCSNAYPECFILWVNEVTSKEMQ